MPRLRLSAQLGSLESFRHFVLTEIRNWNISQDLSDKAELILEELLTNVFHYAYPSGNGDVEVECEQEASRFCIIIRDWGAAFNPLEKNDPELSDDIAKRDVGGLGIYLVKKMVDEISYTRENDMNTLTLYLRARDN